MNSVKPIAVALLLLAATAAPGQQAPPPSIVPERPNILLIVADDMGYSDVGVYGGEIATPNIDALAAEGLQFTQFHVAPNCGPTRGSMLTGVDYHRAGMGGNVEVAADNQRGDPAYQGFLRDDVISFVELLRDAGYRTSMAGKWHLGHDARNLPGGRGFDRSFALLNGAASHWQDMAPIIPGSATTYTQNDVVVSELPDDFYSSGYYADRIVEYIGEGLNTDSPFFAYLSFTAPHNPLHVPDEYRERYQGIYDEGWDKIASERYSRQRELGLLPTGRSSRPNWVMSWDELNEKQKAERAADMEVYAGMIEYLDQEIGRVLDYLRQTGLYENTLIVFLSDNGPSKTSILDYLELGGESAEFFKGFDNSLVNKGRPGSSIDIGPGWAYAAATPLRLFKGYVAQGGIQVPAVLKLPERQGAGDGKVDTPIHVMDLAPTLLELAGVDYPGQYKGIPSADLQGVSFVPILNGEKSENLANRAFGWEAYGMDAYRAGEWKILRLPEPYGNGGWQLYNLQNDPGESHDLAGENPSRVAALERLWLRYAEENGVIHPDQPVAYARPSSLGKY